MLNGKTISIKNIIWETYRNSGIQDELNESDLIEWAVDCLEKIYHPDVFQKKVLGHIDDTNLDYTNFRFPIPKDLVHMVAVSINGFRAYKSTFDYQQLANGECCDLTIGSDEITEGQIIDNFGNIFKSNDGNKIHTGGFTYELNNNWVTTNIKEGKACIAYLAHPVDCDGFPLIPDHIQFKEALSKFLISKIDYIRWRQNPSDDGLRSLYEHSERESNYYIAQALNFAKLPDVDKMETIKNQMLRLKPNINHWCSNFRNLSIPEIRWNK